VGYVTGPAGGSPGIRVGPGTAGRGHDPAEPGRDVELGQVLPRGPRITGALIAIISLVRLARVVRACPGLAFLLAGALLSMAGNMLPSGVVFIAGMLVFLRGAAVLLGVSEPRHPGGQPAGRADFFGFGTPPPGRG
jgi:hypothetical protein